MGRRPLETCPTCNKPVVYVKVIEKWGDLRVEAICSDNHVEKFITPRLHTPEWHRLMAKMILSCAVCGRLTIPDRNTIKRGKTTQKFNVKCRSGCNDKYEREIWNDLVGDIRKLLAQRRRGVKPFSKPIPRIGGRFPRRKPRTIPPKPRVRITIPDECPHCDAPLKKEQIEKLRNNEIIECQYCGSAIQPKKEEV
ncbi:MAG: hypothetical protein ACFFCM_07210 [Promethearchaeota archaeon]